MPATLFGYKILHHLGDGAGSRIYAASHPVTRQICALKHVVRSDDKSVRFIEQLENEYSVGKNLRHKGLRAVIDMHVQRSLMMRVQQAGLVMELFQGEPLDRYLPTLMSEIIDIFIRTAEALQAMHDAGYVHCDLKPGNIMTTGEGDVKVIDLGQACPIGTSKPRIQGTPDYIAPEQVKCKPVSPQTDVYNFGATMYWALTGKKMPTLFTIAKGENSFLVDSQIQTPHQINPMVPESLSNFVIECVRTTPQKRPESMTVVKNRLEVLHHMTLKVEATRRSSVA
ncbi:MAG: serine/threonine protein kinase [Burkholderiales bacterium]|nr:serine/threonine protein kinase [Phycisphaerae bacterium]